MLCPHCGGEVLLEVSPEIKKVIEIAVARLIATTCDVAASIEETVARQARSLRIQVPPEGPY